MVTSAVTYQQRHRSEAVGVQEESVGSWEHITPARAEEYLATIVSGHERRPMMKMVDRYAQDMREGKWNNKSPEPVVFDLNGNMIDGQHRMMAVIQSDTTQRFFVHRGVDPSVKNCLNTGKSRSTKNVLQILGYPATDLRVGVLNTVAPVVSIAEPRQKMRDSQAEDAWKRFESPILFCETRLKMFRNAAVISPMVIAIDQGVPRYVIEPYRDVFCNENLPPTEDRYLNPAVFLRSSIERKHENLLSGNAAQKEEFFRVSTRALQAYLLGDTMKQVTGTRDTDFLKSYRTGVRKGIWK